jgi:hypothetical protein
MSNARVFVAAVTVAALMSMTAPVYAAPSTFPALCQYGGGQVHPTDPKNPNSMSVCVGGTHHGQLIG